jgi:competence ComEA-like helix-hairpin-helix protein
MESASSDRDASAPREWGAATARGVAAAPSAPDATSRRLAGTVAAIVALFLFFAAPALAKKLPSHPINLNTATLRQFEELSDIGPAMAHRMLAFREKSGPFEPVQDLLAICGIGYKRFKKIRPYVFIRHPRGGK